MGIVLAGLSALLFGVADFAGGLATRESRVHAVLIYSQLAGLALAAAVAPMLSPGPVLMGDLLWGMAAGVAGAFGLVFLYRGLAVGVIAVVSPVAAVVGAAVPVIAGLMFGESPTLTGWLGIGVALPAIVLLGWETDTKARGERLRSSLRLGFLAGIGFGAFFVLISRPESIAGLWPLVAARAASISTVALFALVTRRAVTLEKPSVVATLVAGVFDMGANIAFVLASRLYLLSVVAVVTSLYPAPTVFLGRLVLKERITLPRVAGLLCALIGVALMSV